MSKLGLVLIQTHDEWYLANDRGKAAAICSCGATADMVADQVAVHPSNQSGAARISIVLESSRVLSDHVCCSARDARNRSALLFQFESTLPYSAEQLTADFQPANEGVFGVGVLTADVEPLVAQLESRGMQVESISAAPVLALQSLLKDQKIEPDTVVVWCDQSVAEVLVLRNRSLRQWMQVPNQPDAIRNALAVITRRSPEITSVVVVNSEDGLDDEIAGIFDDSVTVIESATLQDHAVAMAGRILALHDEPWFELRREALAAADPIRSVRRPLQIVLAAVGLFLIVLTATFWIRARSYDQQVEAFRDQESRLFAELFPDSRIPAGVLSRLESEYARMAGARGANRDQAIPLPFPALTVLEQFLNSLPPEERMQFSSVRINDGRIDVDANLRNHGSAGVLVSALQQNGFSVVPPTSEKKDERSVTSLVHGSLLPSDREQP